MLEDTRLTAAAAPPVAGLDGDCVTRAWTGPSAVGGGGDACPSVGGGGGHLQQRPPPVVAVGDILQQAIAEVSNDRSGAVFSGEAVTAAALESGVLGIVGSVTPEMLGMGNVKILTTDRLFYSENEAAFSYLMEAESGVERPGISKHLLDCVTADCVQKIDEVEGVRVYPAEFSEPDEGQRLATLIDATGGMVDAVPPEPIAAEDENQTLVENRIEIENGAPKFQPRTPSSKDGAKSAPLGSSQNPIRLVQQGNRYKSLQNLTPEQLAQIMQVVQQQQLIRSSKETGQASVLYNPQTQTKIIFRVVNPSEMQKRATGAARSVKLSAKTGAGTTTVLHGRKKAPYKKKKLRTEPPKEAVQEIRKEIKGRKKALRRRTRYGRLSRPPSYMVSDYKRINRVDFAEDDEDSEGEYGYSDFQGDDSENEKVTKSKNTKSVYINTDNSDPGSLKPKKHQCRTCEKNYIGFKGLARHLRLNPSHESGNSSSDFANPNISAGDGKEPVTSSARDSSRVDNSNESSDSNPENSRDLTAEDTPVPPERSLGVRTRGRARSSVSQAKTTARSRPDKSSTPDPSHDPPKRKRGRPPATARAKSRQSKLQEMVDQCTDEEVLNVFMPRLRSSVGVFDFFLQKTTGENSQPDLRSMLSEFEEFHKLIGATLQENLVPVRPGKTANEDGSKDEMEESAEESTALTNQETKLEKSVIEICDNDFARCLGMNTGSYELKADAPLLSHKLFAPIPVAAPESPIQPSSHIDEMVSQGQVATLPLRKRLRLTENAGTATIAPSPAMDRSDGGCNTLSSNQPAVEGTLPVGGNLEHGGDAMLDRPVVKVDDTEKNNGPNLCTSGSSDGTGYVVSGVGVLEEEGRNSVKSEEDRISGAVAVAVPMGSEPVSVELASCRLPFQSNNFLDVYSPHGSQTPDGCAKALEHPLGNSYYGNEADRLVDRTPAAATTFTSAELQPVNSGDLAPCDKSYPPLVAAEPSLVYRDVLAGIGYGVQGSASSQFVSPEAVPVERNLLTLPGSEFVLVSGTAVEAQAQGGGGTGEIATGQQEMQVDDASGAAVVPTSRDLVIVQNPDGSFMIHGQPGQDIPLEMVQTLIGLEHGGQVVFSDAQPGYVVENWNPLK